MGGSKVIFDKQGGACYTKGKKRMRGGEIIRGPEVKKWNALKGSSGGFQAVDFVNNILGVTSDDTVLGYSPAPIVWPTIGNTGLQRIGNRIDFRALRLKGWITLAADQLKQIRWRLVLCRLDQPDANLAFSTQAYLAQFINSDTNVPTSFSQTTINSFTRHNFYKKFKDVENRCFKCKVIASGCLPPTNVFQKMAINLDGTIAGQAALLTCGTRSNYVTGLHTENCGYIPIDVTVAINDTIDCSATNRRYFLVFEADCGYGWTNEGSANQSQIGMIVNVYARGYFTDA